jgi:hypothetical protein
MNPDVISPNQLPVPGGVIVICHFEMLALIGCLSPEDKPYLRFEKAEQCRNCTRYAGCLSAVCKLSIFQSGSLLSAEDESAWAPQLRFFKMWLVLVWR